MLAAWALYAAYLPLSGYGPEQFRFDAAEYWELSLKFTPHGQFSLLAFDDALRGYLGPLLVLPARLLCHVTGWSIPAGARALGAGWAAALFGLALPQLWARVAGRPPAGGRWLLLLGLGFAFWRDYFNFPLSDMPALALLLLGLAALTRPGWAGAGAAGLLLAAASNLRPVYLASAPGWLWLLAAAPRPAGGQLRRLAALAAGAALLLLPQLLINLRHFDRATPLVLARQSGARAPALYLEKLNRGLEQQKYETTYATDYPVPIMQFRSAAGTRLLRAEAGGDFRSYGQYARAVLGHPLTAAGVVGGHLFNGLDVQYPTPYIRAVYRPSWALAGLNYTLWFGVALVVGGAWHRRWPPALGPVLAALLGPCLAVLPLGIECRYLLPLHLLLCAALSFGWPAAWTWPAFWALPARRRWGLLAAYAGFVGLCFAASAAAQATLEFGPRALF